MTRRQFDRIVRQALDSIPEDFQRAMKNLEILVEDWPDPEMMEEVFGDRDEVPYGLFIGTPLPEQHFDDVAPLPCVIRLYQGPLEEDFPDLERLKDEIEITLVHEIAHYMGFDEDILTEYGYG